MKFRHSGPFDIVILQQMIQGTDLSCMSFNVAAGHIIFLAEDHGAICGIACGTIHHDNGQKIVEIGQTFLRHYWDTLEHENELCLHLMEWAQQQKGATHYRKSPFETPRPIDVQHFIPQIIPQTAQIVVVETDTATAPARDFAYA